ncbi:hypothetical protein LWI29_014535 [Acer saccharum]|uniref:Uncharacterized protein n=1 Tax=Acer saccharum TaxID=4024 RepID=A0AA39TEB5_ACESA|nr:hypothetical protein LWI29_014535 [Acer saccharum]
MGVLVVLVIVLIFANFGVHVAAAASNFTQFDSSCNNTTSCNTSLDDKRGVPTGANPLHNSVGFVQMLSFPRLIYLSSFASVNPTQLPAGT